MVKILQELIKYHAHHQHDGSAFAYEKDSDAAETASAKTVVIMITPKQIAIPAQRLISEIQNVGVERGRQRKVATT